MDIPAGTTESTVDCPTAELTVTVGVVSFTFTTPSACPSSKTTYMSAVYRRGGSTAGSHCIAQGYMVPFQVYSFGGNSAAACPSPASLSFDSFAAAFVALGCQAIPLITDSFDWSAKVTRCPEAPPSAPPNDETHGSETTTPEGTTLVWNGDPEEHAVEFVPAPLEAWLAALPRMAEEHLPAPVQAFRGMTPRCRPSKNWWLRSRSRSSSMGSCTRDRC